MNVLGWESIRTEAGKIDAGVLAEAGQWSVAADLEGDGPTSLYFQNRGVVAKSLTLPEPRSVDIAADGTAVIADWIEFGTRTQAEIHVLRSESDLHKTTTVDLSSPLVAVNPTGEHFVVTGYDQTVRIYETTSLSLVGQHTALFGERLVPRFEPTTGEIVLSSGQAEDTDLQYRIDIQGAVVHTTDDVEKLQYAQSFDLDKDSDWSSVVPELTELYHELSTEPAQNIIANTLGDASLAYLTNESTLETVIDTVSTAHQEFQGDHQKLSASVLADAHYRLGKVRHKQGYRSEAHNEWETAENYASTVLPWYDGKDLLAKIHRKRARAHKKANQYQRATHHVQRIFELEEEYDVELASDADRRLYDAVS